jgi:hypothetical protein
VSGLRPVICPYEIVEEFIRISNMNTNSKIETCAILAGIERDNTLIIDTLIIPQ